jgi:hypothetical protein
MSRNVVTHDDVFAAFVWALAARGETHIRVFGAELDRDFRIAFESWLRDSDWARGADLPRFARYPRTPQPSTLASNASPRRGHGYLVGNQEIHKRNANWTYEETLEFLVRLNQGLGPASGWLDLADIFIGNLIREERQRAFTAFIWALGARGETSLDMDGSRFDEVFQHIWEGWMLRPDVSESVQSRLFDLDGSGVRPQDIRDEARSWTPHAPLGADYEIQVHFDPTPIGALERHLKVYPNLGSIFSWLALADQYLPRINKKDQRP